MRLQDKGAGEVGALPDAEEERDCKAAKEKKCICDVCGNGHDYGTIQHLRHTNKNWIHSFHLPKKPRKLGPEKLPRDAMRARLLLRRKRAPPKPVTLPRDA